MSSHQSDSPRGRSPPRELSTLALQSGQTLQGGDSVLFQDGPLPCPPELTEVEEPALAYTPTSVIRPDEYPEWLLSDVNPTLALSLPTTVPQNDGSAPSSALPDLGFG